MFPYPINECLLQVNWSESNHKQTAKLIRPTSAESELLLQAQYIHSHQKSKLSFV